MCRKVIQLCGVIRSLVCLTLCFAFADIAFAFFDGYKNEDPPQNLNANQRRNQTAIFFSGYGGER